MFGTRLVGWYTAGHMTPTVRSPLGEATDRVPGALLRGRLAAGAGCLVAGIVLYYVAPLPLAVAGAALFLLGAWLRLDLALTVVILTCPFYLPVAANPLPDKEIGSLHFPLVEFAILACTLAWLVRVVYPPARGERPRKIARKSWFPVAAFVGAAVISTVFSEYRTVAIRELRTTIVEPALFGIIVMTTVDRRGVQQLVWSMVVGCAAVSLYSFYHYLVINIVEATGGVRRVLAVYHSPNQLALYLDRVVPAALAFGLPEAGERLDAWTRRGVPALIAAGLGFGALFLTYSRGAWLAVGIACLAAAAFRGRRIFLPAISLAVAGATVVLSKINPERLLSEQTSLQRPTIWGAALNMLRDHPIFGVGPDNFLYFYRDRGYLPPEGWAEPDISHPHNVLLDTWLRTGVLGLLALLTAQWVFWTSAWRELRDNGGVGTCAALALAAGMLAAVIHGMFDNGYFLIDLAVLFWAGYAAMQALVHERDLREIA